MCLWSQPHLKNGLLFLPDHVRSRHTDATWGVMEAVSSCPLHPLLSQQLYSQPLLYTTPSINLVSASCLDLLPGSSILYHSHCPSYECVRTISVWPLGCLLNVFIPDTCVAAESCDYANIFTHADRLCPGCNYAWQKRTCHHSQL